MSGDGLEAAKLRRMVEPLETQKQILLGTVERLRGLLEAAEAWPKFIEQYTAWAIETFPNGTAQSASIHLTREAKELADDQTPEELADCLMLLLFIAHRMRIDLLAEARRKFEINQSRQWAPPDSEGIAEHVRQSASPVTPLPDASGAGDGARRR